MLPIVNLGDSVGDTSAPTASGEIRNQIAASVLVPSIDPATKSDKKKGGCEVIFYCQLEFAGTLITYPMQTKHM